MLEMRLPAFKSGYERGRTARKSMTDEAVIASLELLFKEGVFLDPDRTKLQWHVGHLLGIMSDDGRTLRNAPMLEEDAPGEHDGRM